jgi:putative ABC transport system permease protein
VLAHLRRQPLGLATIGITVFTAAVCFALLASSTASSQLSLTSTVKRNFRAAYDILVRPHGAVTAFERRRRLVDPGFLSGLFGGITLAQYREISRLPGVSLAAPVANVGYVLVQASVFVSLPNALRSASGAVYRTTVTWDVHHGLAHYPGAPIYVYRTSSPIRFTSFTSGVQRLPDGEVENVCSGFSEGVSHARVIGRKNGVPVFGPPVNRHPYASALLPSFYCSSAHLSYSRAAVRETAPSHAAGEPANRFGVQLNFELPVLIAGIDPDAEARLVGLPRATVSGGYLREGEGLSPPQKSAGLSAGGPLVRTYPVMASVDTFLDERAELDLRRLRLPSGAALVRLLGSPASYGALTNASSGGVLDRVAVGPTAAWRAVLRAFPHVDAGGFSAAYWRVGSTRDGLENQAVTPYAVPNDPSVWIDNSPEAAVMGGSLAPPGADDVWYRHIRVYGASGEVRPVDGRETFVVPDPRLVGTFDPSRLEGFSALSRVPLQTFYPPLAGPGDAAAARLLKGAPLGPTTDLGGYLAQPPLLLTTLQGALALDNGDGESYVSRYRYRSRGRSVSGSVPIVAYRGASPAAPISSIQVRVKGVTGPNALSLARIRLVAEQIAADTGLTVDTTAGSSPTPIRVRLGSGRFGTPPLTLSQGWVREGVDSEIVQAVDAKDVGLLGVALLVSALAIAGAALAAARRRRGEIALLSSLGWTRGRLVGLMLGEVASVSALAGVAALAVAGVLNAAGLLVLSPLEFSLIVIVPFALASVAAVVPSWRAASAPPLEPLTQPVKVSRGRRLTRAIAWFAFANTVRVRGRTILAVISLALGIGAFAAVLGISLAFKGAVAGDLLGNVIVLRTRSADLIWRAVCQGVRHEFPAFRWSGTLGGVVGWVGGGRAAVRDARSD